MKPTFTNHLKTLMLGGAIALAANQAASAAASTPVATSESSVDLRVAKVREVLETPNTLKPGQNTGQANAGMMWWRNAWGNGGGWHNWHNGWHNGGWGNWHNW
jgi:rSAM-associated Gly-rich repeat protein